MDVEETLSGGNMDPVVRLGDTVRRATGEWSPAAHALLGAYEHAGIDETPRVHGIDEQGREILTFLEGAPLAEQPSDILWDPGILRAAGGVGAKTCKGSRTGRWGWICLLPRLRLFRGATS